MSHGPPPIVYWLHSLGITGTLLAHLIMGLLVVLGVALIVVAWLAYLFIKFSSEHFRLGFELLKTIVDALVKELRGKIPGTVINIERGLLIVFILALLICGLFWAIFAHEGFAGAFIWAWAVFCIIITLVMLAAKSGDFAKHLQ